ncbi:MFS transporter [Kitasatospora sp. HPMI-4]|uniref:MFS transporter n=1 Tax=Kitasatospora sp. HPMI-4 TaxID=3448443 RepID=UPI003F1A2ED2
MWSPGILLARALSGALADLAGWRSVYLVSAVLTLLLAGVLHRVPPRRPDAEAGLSYGRSLLSTVALYRRERPFRRRAVLALLIFAAFSTLWSSVALPLSEAPLSLPHTGIGAFGLVGAAGALAAVPAGRWTDRGHARWVTGGALGLLTLSWLPIALIRRSLWALAVGAVLLDLAVQAVHVTSQTLIQGIRPAAVGRLIGAYMVCYSIGSGLGAVTSTTVYAAAGWPAVCALGAGISLLALLYWAVRTRSEVKRHPAGAGAADVRLGHREENRGPGATEAAA